MQNSQNFEMNGRSFSGACPAGIKLHYLGESAIIQKQPHLFLDSHASQDHNDTKSQPRPSPRAEFVNLHPSKKRLRSFARWAAGIGLRPLVSFGLSLARLFGNLRTTHPSTQILIWETSCINSSLGIQKRRWVTDLVLSQWRPSFAVVMQLLLLETRIVFRGTSVWKNQLSRRNNDSLSSYSTCIDMPSRADPWYYAWDQAHGRELQEDPSVLVLIPFDRSKSFPIHYFLQFSCPFLRHLNSLISPIVINCISVFIPSLSFSCRASYSCLSHNVQKLDSSVRVYLLVT